MKLDDLAQRLSDPARVGLNEALAQKLGIVSADATRGRLMAGADDTHPYLGVYLLAIYVVNDTDFWGDGEIYWWTVPTMVDVEKKVQKNALHGIPTGMAPHKCGSMEWMTNLSLKDPPLLAVIPPDERIAACTIRLAVYDDDGALADLPGAVTAGLETLAGISSEAMVGPEQIITPVRDTIWKKLRAEQDDVLIDQDVTLLRGETVRFGAGIIGSVINSMARAYYFVRDFERTEQFGPVMLHKGQTENVKFPRQMKGGGRLALFARGADVSCSAFGDLTTDMPFMNRVIESRLEGGLENGFNVTGQGPAKFVAYYTAPPG